MTPRGQGKKAGTPFFPRGAVAIGILVAEFAALSGSSIAIGQSTTADTAANYRAYEKLLIRKWGRCDISDTDFRAQTQAAERLFFDAYNQGYAGRGTTATAQFLAEIAQHEQAVEAKPGVYDLSPVCKAVLADVVAFPQSARAASSAPPPAASSKTADTCTEWQVKSGAATDCQCAVPKNPLPPSPDPSLSLYPLKYVDVRTGFCLGATVDGIAFVPKGTSRGMCYAEHQHFKTTHDTSTCNAANPDPDTLHIIQFVNTQCQGCTKDTYSVGRPVQIGETSTTLVETRNLTGNSWYLDSLDGSPYLSPDGYVPVGLSPTGTITSGTQRIHVINDEPTANLRADHDAPLTKRFYDFVMCDGTVMEVFSWSRQGNRQPRWCGSSASRTMNSTYGPVQTVAIPDIPTEAKSGICNADNVDSTQAGNADIRSIRNQLCGAKQ